MLVPVALPAALTSIIFPPLIDDLRAVGFTVAFARGEIESADARDARQRFAAKTHRGDRAQIFRALNFAGGVAFEAEQRVVFAHAESVVGHTNQTASAGLNFHGDARGIGIERSFPPTL